MRVPRLLLEQALTPGASLDLPPETLRHAVTVLRLGEGAPCRIFDGRGMEYHAHLRLSGRKKGQVELGALAAAPTTPALFLRLLQGVARGEHMDLALQKAVELGVSEIVPVLTERSRSAGAHRGLEGRVRHWAGIIGAAAEQCGRNELPILRAVTDFESILSGPVARDSHALPIVAAPGGHHLWTLPHSISAEKPVAINLLIGPEGGWAPNEFQQLQNRGWLVLDLGPRILRTETATIVALTLLQLRWGDLSHGTASRSIVGKIAEDDNPSLRSVPATPSMDDGENQNCSGG